MAHGQVVFIAVGTPPDEDGSADLQYVLAVARTIGQHMSVPTVVVNKSTVPVGTADKVRAAIAAELAARGGHRLRRGVQPGIPEGRRRRCRLHAPGRIIIGATSAESVAVMRRLYAPFNRNHDRVVEMDVRSAELTKYAANAMLATKISFMNEIANIAERVGADVEQVRQGIGSDPRIGWHFIYPGAGYGGSCFPKDVQALARTAQQAGLEPKLLNAVEAVNDAQKGHLFALIQRHYDKGEVKWQDLCRVGPGLQAEHRRHARSLQPSPAGAAVGRRCDGACLRSGSDARGAAHLRRARSWCSAALPNEALQGADALVVVTEWKQFRSPDFAALLSS
jgi:UDPglucose 6-dehydrogenase